jgi:hypothetical protein
MPSEERGTLSWRNAKKEAMYIDNNSEILASDGGEESIEYVEEYVEEEIISDDEYDEVIVEEIDEIKVAECVDSNKLNASTLSKRIEKAELPANSMEEQESTEPGTLDVEKETQHDTEEAPIEPLVMAESLEVAEWTTFESQPTDRNIQEEDGTRTNKEISVVDNSLKVFEWTTLESQLTIGENQVKEAFRADKNEGKEIVLTPAEGQCNDDEVVAANSVADFGMMDKNVDESQKIKVGESRGVDLQCGNHQRGVSSQTPCMSQHINDKDNMIGWEKPDWVMNSPLKNKKSSVNLSIESSEKNVGWEKPVWTQAQLRSTGKDLKKGVDLQAPITHVNKEHMNDVNFEANPMVLKSSSKGTDVRLGENLAKPITHYAKDPMADVNFVANPEFILKPTKIGDKLKQKGNLEAPITHIEKDNMDDINFEANPLILKPTDKGFAVRLGENLARPITFINGKKPSECTF